MVCEQHSEAVVLQLDQPPQESIQRRVIVLIYPRGERLLTAIGPRFDEIEAELAALSELRDKPAGTIRITSGMDAARSILWSAAEPLLRDYPDIRVEISVNPGFVDIVAEQFDAGIRLGETIAQDMVAVRIGPDLSMAAVSSPAYFESTSYRGPPTTSAITIASICVSQRLAGCTRGSSRSADGQSTSGSKVS